MKSLNYYTTLAQSLDQRDTVEALESQALCLAGGEVTCPDCAKNLRLAQGSLCYYCGLYRCHRCAEAHYGRTSAEHLQIEIVKLHGN